jgi:NDP-sugar pyrophosphorylase family protein
MKALIYCKSTKIDWIKKNFGDISPYMLQVVNKPLLEYYIDFCSLKQVTDVRIVSVDDNGSIERHFEDGGKWGLGTSYNLAKETDTIKDVYSLLSKIRFLARVS